MHTHTCARTRTQVQALEAGKIELTRALGEARSQADTSARRTTALEARVREFEQLRVAHENDRTTIQKLQQQVGSAEYPPRPAP